MFKAYDVEAEPGMMGGSESRDFLAPAAAGRERHRLLRERRLRCGHRGRAHLAGAGGPARALDAPEEVETPGVTTIEGLADFLGIDPSATSKAMPHATHAGEVVLALIRGDDRLEEAKLAAAFGVPLLPATDEQIKAAFGASGGSLGPVGFKGVRVIADFALQEGQYVAGANRDGFHLRGVGPAATSSRFADLRLSTDTDTCPTCGGTLRFESSIEVGHIFKLGTKYSEPLGARFLDEDGKEKPLVMGSYGIGLGRVMAAAVEQHHDENGIVWPRSIAPYDAHVVVLPGGEEIGQAAAEALSAAGLDVLLDDRDQRAGEKFADADLIGCPIRITVGKKSLEDGKVDFRDRANGDEKRLDVAALGKEVA